MDGDDGEEGKVERGRSGGEKRQKALFVFPPDNSFIFVSVEFARISIGAPYYRCAAMCRLQLKRRTDQFSKENIRR